MGSRPALRRLSTLRLDSLGGIIRHGIRSAVGLFVIYAPQFRQNNTPSVVLSLCDGWHWLDKLPLHRTCLNDRILVGVAAYSLQSMHCSPPWGRCLTLWVPTVVGSPCRVLLRAGFLSFFLLCSAQCRMAHAAAIAVLSRAERNPIASLSVLGSRVPDVMSFAIVLANSSAKLLPVQSSTSV